MRFTKEIRWRERMNSEKISKILSYALRHRPDEFGITLDEQGWVSLTVLLEALHKQKDFENLTEEEIREMIATSQKKRHEIVDGRIRAIYGHSTAEKIVKKAEKPPRILYHGTARRFIDSILTQGLLPKERQYVHLSEEKETAMTVGKRRDADPLLLEIDAEKAWKEGFLFYPEEGKIWLSDAILPKYIRVI